MDGPGREEERERGGERRGLGGKLERDPLEAAGPRSGSVLPVAPVATRRRGGASGARRQARGRPRHGPEWGGREPRGLPQIRQLGACSRARATAARRGVPAGIHRPGYGAADAEPLPARRAEGGWTERSLDISFWACIFHFSSSPPPFACTHPDQRRRLLRDHRQLPLQANGRLHRVCWRARTKTKRRFGASVLARICHGAPPDERVHGHHPGPFRERRHSCAWTTGGRP